jgi:uncharacterized protein
MGQPVYTLTSECHLARRGNRRIAYFPLKSIALEVDAGGEAVIGELKTGGGFLPPDADADRTGLLQGLVSLGLVNGHPDREPRRGCSRSPRPSKALLMVSDACTLACPYCYGSASPDGELMPPELAISAVDFTIDNALESGTPLVTLAFNGGGEPTTNWDVLRLSVEHAERRTQQQRLGLRTILVTNGMISRHQVQWIARHIQALTVSIDGPPSVQDYQRPTVAGSGSSHRVTATLDGLHAAGKDYKLRVTVSRDSVERLPEIYRYLARRFAPRVISVEPVFSCGRSARTGFRGPDTERFLANMERVLALQRELKVPVSYAGARLDHLDDCFCEASGRAFCVTPRGEVTSCIEVGDPQDPRANLFHYGRFDATGGGFVFYGDCFEKLRNLHVQRFECCRDCIARWHCAGDCLAKVPDPVELCHKRDSDRCRVNRSLVERALLSKLNAAPPSRIPHVLHICDLVNDQPQSGHELIGEREWRRRSAFLLHKGTRTHNGQLGYFAHRSDMCLVVKGTNLCDAGCTYCSSYKDYRVPDMGPDVRDAMYQAVHQYARANGVRVVTYHWHGGEPTLLGKEFYREAWDATDGIRDLQVAHRFQSHLCTLDDEWIDLFKQYRVQVGSSVNPVDEGMRRWRGGPMLPALMKSVALAAQHGLGLGFVFIASPTNFHRVDEVYQFFENLSRASRAPIAFKVNQLYASGKASFDRDASLPIRPYDYGTFLIELWNRAWAGGLANRISPFREWFQRTGLPCELGGECAAHFACVDGAGNVFHCGRYFDLGKSYGNLLDSDLPSVLLHRERLELLERSKRLRETHCRRCEVWEFCHGGCPYFAQVYFGDKMREDPFCASYRRLFEETSILDVLHRYHRGRARPKRPGLSPREPV